MQNAKDTFYVTLQGRLAAINPARVITVRGVLRPGILVEENELPAGWMQADAFVLRWSGLSVVTESPLPLAAMTCEIRYATDGDTGKGGMDRGRLLAAMDAELVSALTAEPRTALKKNYAAAGMGAGPVAMGTSLFWGDVAFGAAAVMGERLERTATVPVFAYQEAGEL